jgi:hypothetical protein
MAIPVKKLRIWLLFNIIAFVILFVMMISSYTDPANKIPPFPEGSETELGQNIALGKPVKIFAKNNDKESGYGHQPSDITDGSLEFLPLYHPKDDGVIVFAKRNRNLPLEVNVKINLESNYRITAIRYNPGNFKYANFSSADLIKTPFGETSTNPSSKYEGAWTTIYGNIIASSVDLTFYKLKNTKMDIHLNIGEVEIYGIAIEENTKTK